MTWNPFTDSCSDPYTWIPCNMWALLTVGIREPWYIWLTVKLGMGLSCAFLHTLCDFIYPFIKELAKAVHAPLLSRIRGSIDISFSAAYLGWGLFFTQVPEIEYLSQIGINKCVVRFGTLSQVDRHLSDFELRSLVLKPALTFVRLLSAVPTHLQVKLLFPFSGTVQQTAMHWWISLVFPIDAQSLP